MNAITSLRHNEVFVFGSNSTGFHGAGAAGYALRGTAKNTWRTDPWFLRAMRAPAGSAERIGKWAVFGVARGFMEGREGASYAIQTIDAPGRKRSTPLSAIQEQFERLFAFAREHPHLTFLMTPVGAQLSGWSKSEMSDTFDAACKAVPVPPNVVIPPDLYR